LSTVNKHKYYLLHFGHIYSSCNCFVGIIKDQTADRSNQWTDAWSLAHITQRCCWCWPFNAYLWFTRYMYESIESRIKTVRLKKHTFIP